MKYFDIYDALIAIKTKKEAKDFLLDLCTPAVNLLAITERWKVCQFLYNGDLSYRKIKDETGKPNNNFTCCKVFKNGEK